MSHPGPCYICDGAHGQRICPYRTLQHCASCGRRIYMRGDHASRCKQPHWLSQWAMNPYARPLKTRFKIKFHSGCDELPGIYSDIDKKFHPFPAQDAWASPVFDIRSVFTTGSAVKFETTGYVRIRLVLVEKRVDGSHRIVAKFQTSNDQTVMMFKMDKVWRSDTGPPLDMAFNTVMAICLPLEATFIKVRVYGHNEKLAVVVPFKPAVGFQIPPELTEDAESKISFDAPMYNYPTPGVPKKKELRALYDEVRESWKEQVTPEEWQDYKKHIRRARRIATQPNLPLCKFDHEHAQVSNSSDSEWSMDGKVNKKVVGSKIEPVADENKDEPTSGTEFDKYLQAFMPALRESDPAKKLNKIIKVRLTHFTTDGKWKEEASETAIKQTEPKQPVRNDCIIVEAQFPFSLSLFFTISTCHTTNCKQMWAI